MKTVFKCDFCTKTNNETKEILEHEPDCSFNPIKRKCWTCKHAFEDVAPISGHIAGCKKGLNAHEGEDEGNCIGWDLEL